MSVAEEWPPIVDRAVWDDARAVLQQEKALTRMKDAISAARRRMPMVEVRSDYRFHGPDGTATLLDLFDGHPQLIVQHFMFGPDWQEGCDGCSMMAEHIGPLSHLHARRTAFVLSSRAPLERLHAFRERMGWDLPWYSTEGDAFNIEFGATVDGEEQQAISVFLRRGDRVFHTWSIYARGEEPFMMVFDLLDLGPGHGFVGEPADRPAPEHHLVVGHGEGGCGGVGACRRVSGCFSLQDDCVHDQ
ncbi:DUF899 domain-containing protein [Brevibacterium sp. CS2]|uniref:DUF899 domain-containing protein n=1 Tax=Brevibacterium sp. CS2 TaxID=2575923 RepID=UPI0010C7DDEE|nr:DUF899 domain-containing protein [Brevibacterium sp. CS2]QCP05598.1 DUF899 domain-containing protein [Brevibacterium sp. CS2]